MHVIYIYLHVCELCELSVGCINLYRINFLLHYTITMLEMLKSINKKVGIFVKRSILSDLHNFLTRIPMYLYVCYP